MFEGRSVKAFRPSRVAAREETDENADNSKKANMELYVARAQAGLPLFDTASPIAPAKARRAVRF